MPTPTDHALAALPRLARLARTHGVPSVSDMALGLERIVEILGAETLVGTPGMAAIVADLRAAAKPELTDALHAAVALDEGRFEYAASILPA